MVMVAMMLGDNNADDDDKASMQGGGGDVREESPLFELKSPPVEIREKLHLHLSHHHHPESS